MAFAIETALNEYQERQMVAPDEKALLSTKKIPRQERLIVALDFPTPEAAFKLVDVLGDSAHFYKVGLELMLAGNYVTTVQRLADLGKHVFVDIKMFDVPETVGSAIRQLKGKADFATVHAIRATIQAACRERDEKLKILAVTVLTSLDRDDRLDLDIPLDSDVELRDVVLSKARRMLEAGCDGVISSGLEAAELRAKLGDGFLIVSPGIRPLDHQLTDDDQKRVVTPREAFLRGADYIVVGRPIKHAVDPRDAALEIQETIADLFEE